MRPLGVGGIGRATVSSVRGLHLEVREALTIVDFEEDHQLVI
jgi:hypothetical protein